MNGDAETPLTRSRGARLLNVADPRQEPGSYAFLAPPLLGPSALGAEWYQQAGQPSPAQNATWIAQGWPGREFALGRMSPTPLYPAAEGAPQPPTFLDLPAVRLAQGRMWGPAQWRERMQEGDVEMFGRSMVPPGPVLEYPSAAVPRVGIRDFVPPGYPIDIPPFTERQMEPPRPRPVPAPRGRRGRRRLPQA
jgi:hypothetical protein